MRGLLSACFGILLGGSLVYVAHHYHLVQTDETILVVPKQIISLEDIYVDIRDWDANRWREHPQLAHSLIESGHGNLVPNQSSESLLHQLFHSMIQPQH